MLLPLSLYPGIKSIFQVRKSLVFFSFSRDKRELAKIKSNSSKSHGIFRCRRSEIVVLPHPSPMGIGMNCSEPTCL